MQRLSLVDPCHLDGGQILRANEMHSITRVDRMLRDTQDAITASLRENDDAMATARTQAHDAAYAEGLRQFTEAVAALQSAEAQMRATISEHLGRCLTVLLDDVTAPDVFAATIARIVADGKMTSDLVLSVHPTCVSDAQTRLSGIAALGDTSVRVQGDGNLAPDEGIVFAGRDVFNISLPVQMTRFLETIAPTSASDVAP